MTIPLLFQRSRPAWILDTLQPEIKYNFQQWTKYSKNSSIVLFKKRCGKISAQPHTTLCIQFLNKENNDKNNTLPLGKQICFTIVWGCAETLPRRRTVMWNLAAVGRKMTAWKWQAIKKTDPKRLTRPLDTNEYIAVNYSTNTLKYIPYARRTNIQKSKGQKQKALINEC